MTGGRRPATVALRCGSRRRPVWRLCRFHGALALTRTYRCYERLPPPTPIRGRRRGPLVLSAPTGGGKGTNPRGRVVLAPGRGTLRGSESRRGRSLRRRFRGGVAGGKHFHRQRRRDRHRHRRARADGTPATAGLLRRKRRRRRGRGRARRAARRSWLTRPWTGCSSISPSARRKFLDRLVFAFDQGSRESRQWLTELGAA